MSWAIGQTQTYTLLPYEATGGVPWWVAQTLVTGLSSFESAQNAIDDQLNVDDWRSIPNLGPGPSLHSQWSPGVVGFAVAQPEHSLIPLLMGAAKEAREVSATVMGAPPLSGGGASDRPSILQNVESSGFRLLRPRRPPTA